MEICFKIASYFCTTYVLRETLYFLFCSGQRHHEVYSIFLDMLTTPVPQISEITLASQVIEIFGSVLENIPNTPKIFINSDAGATAVVVGWELQPTLQSVSKAPSHANISGSKPNLIHAI